MLNCPSHPQGHHAHITTPTLATLQGVTNTQFVKLIRTCQGLETTEVTALDIIFAKAKAQGERVLNFDEVQY